MKHDKIAQTYAKMNTPKAKIMRQINVLLSSFVQKWSELKEMVVIRLSLLGIKIPETRTSKMMKKISELEGRVVELEIIVRSHSNVFSSIDKDVAKRS